MLDQSNVIQLDDVLITEELSRRSLRQPDLQAENEAMRSLARQLAHNPDQMLQHLTDLAVELCDAGTAGVSLVETLPSGEEVFRWVAVSGRLASNAGGCSPLDFSPCGVCLERETPVLFAHLERYFTYFQAADVPLVEGLVLPLMTEGQVLGTIWIVTHDQQRQFDAEDVRLMTGLADFTTTLLHHQQQAKALQATGTALKQESAERQLAEARALALIENLPGGAAFVVDRDLRYTMAAGKALAIADFQPNDFIGRTIAEVLPPALVARYEPLYRAALAGEPFEYEHHAHGRWYISRGTPLRAEDGEIYEVLAVSYDITDRKQAEATIAANLRDTQRLRELSVRLTSEEDIQVLYGEIMSAAIALTRADAGSFQCFDPDQHELKLLAARGFSQTMIDHFDRIRTSSHTSSGQALTQGERAFVDFDAPDDPDGSLQMHRDAGLLSAQSTPLISRSGRFIGMFSTHWRKHHRPSERELHFLDLLARQAADLIEQRQANIERQQWLEREQAARAEAERANRIKDEFLAILSHELRSPLNPILGWSQLLQQDRQIDPTIIQQALSTIERNAKLQIQLIDDLLDVSRILRGKLKLDAQPVSLAPIIEAAMEVVSTAAEAKSIALQFNSIDHCQVRGDEGRLQQMVWNLLTNAIKFTPDGGRVTVRLDALNDHARITVTDTGKGISPDFLPHLFESFRQEDVSITRHYGGLGLGLSIVKYLVDAHGGSISAVSPGEGQGATFTIQIPLFQEPSAAAASASTPSSATTDLTGIRVLAVDDSQDTRQLLAVFLDHYGAETSVVASGSETLSHLRTFTPDVLVCDIGMPDMDGYTLIQKIRSLPNVQQRSIPAIAVTAFARQEDRQRALAYGFQHHIAKPIQPEMLARAIAQVVIL